MTRRPFNASIWLHAQRDRVQSVELLTIGGYDVEMDFVRYLDLSGRDPYLLRCFAGMEPERAYNVTGAYWFEDGSFDIEIAGFVEIAPVELSEHSDGETLLMWDIFGT